MHQLAVAELAPPAHAHGLVDALVAINTQVVAQGKHLQRHAHVEPLDLYLLVYGNVRGMVYLAGVKLAQTEHGIVNGGHLVSQAQAALLHHYALQNVYQIEQPAALGLYYV